MVSTPSPLIRFEEMGTGDKLNTWGVALNAALELIEVSVHGYVSVAITSAAQSLTVNNYIADQARYRSIELTGVLTANTVITIPSVAHDYNLKNSTTGAFTLTVKTVAGLGAVIRQTGFWFGLICDGLNSFVIDLTLDQIKTAAANVDLGGKKLVNVGAATTANDAATLSNRLNEFVNTPTADVSMGGHKITSIGAALVSTDAASLANTLDQFAAPVANVPFNNKKIIGLTDGASNSQDSATVKQVEALITTAVIPSGNGMVRASASDTTNGFLGAKLLGSTIKNAGGNEQIIAPGPDLYLISIGAT